MTTITNCCLYHRVSSTDQDSGIARDELRAAALNRGMNVAMEVELCHPPQGIGRDGVRRVLELVLEGIATDRKGNGEKRRKA